MVKEPEKDPYDVLSVPFEASDAEISKAYRKLALKFHPDKQRHKTDAEKQAIEKQFHDIKEARSFLLDVEHADDRRQYDTKRQSIRLRQQADALRERSMSDRRKRMRDELRQKEQQAAADLGRRDRQQQQQRSSNESGYPEEGKNDSKRRRRTHQSGAKRDDPVLDELRKDGRRKREQYTTEMDEKQMETELRRETELVAEQTEKRRQEKQQLQNRQVRLKWDRKRSLKRTNKLFHGQSPSEDSLAQLLSEFGTVEHVELLGKKGNQALVTFVDSTSCQPCIDKYANSKDMRAKRVGSQDQEGGGMDDDDETDGNDTRSHQSRRYANETLEERKQRQAMEREELIRQMELDEEEEDSEAYAYDERSGRQRTEDEIRSTASNKQRKPSKPTKASSTVSLFPLPFPKSDEEGRNVVVNASPLKALEEFEQQILKDLLSPTDFMLMTRLTSS